MAYLHKNLLTLMVENSLKDFFTIPYSQPADGLTEKNDVKHFQMPLSSLINIGEKIGEGGSAGFTLAYTANELCLNICKTASAKTDVYSFGITAYEIVSGVTPPWKNILLVINDNLLINVLRENKRPSLNSIRKSIQVLM